MSDIIIVEMIRCFSALKYHFFPNSLNFFILSQIFFFRWLLFTFTWSKLCWSSAALTWMFCIFYPPLRGTKWIGGGKGWKLIQILLKTRYYCIFILRNLQKTTLKTQTIFWSEDEEYTEHPRSMLLQRYKEKITPEKPLQQTTYCMHMLDHTAFGWR